MPLINSDYQPPFHFRNGHISTIYSGLFRRVNDLEQKRVRLELPDGDFLDMDWSYAKENSEKVVILLHGLEGNGQRPYITGSAKIFNENGYDACALNFRGCSGETNRLFRSYHSGATDDLDYLMQHIISLNRYTEIYINGFSLGGNLALKYAGEGRKLMAHINAIIAVSVLATCTVHCGNF